MAINGYKHIPQASYKLVPHVPRKNLPTKILPWGPIQFAWVSWGSKPHSPFWAFSEQKGAFRKNMSSYDRYVFKRWWLSHFQPFPQSEQTYAQVKCMNPLKLKFQGSFPKILQSLRTNFQVSTALLPEHLPATEHLMFKIPWPWEV